MKMLEQDLLSSSIYNQRSTKPNAVLQEFALACQELVNLVVFSLPYSQFMFCDGSFVCCICSAVSCEKHVNV